jgi:hypothetical protein
MKVVLPALFILVVVTLFFVKKTPKHNPYSTVETSWNQLPADSLGYRFIVIGDFDGNGTKETLTESYTDSTMKHEISSIRYYKNNDRIGFLTQKKPVLRLLCNDNKISPFMIENNNTSGLLFVKNVGNIDVLSGDEIAYAVDWLDVSNVNSFRIANYHKGKWSDIDMFPIHESSIPFYHNEDKGIADSLIVWNGFVEHLKNGKTRIFTESKYEFEDTIIVKDFRK